MHIHQWEPTNELRGEKIKTDRNSKTRLRRKESRRRKEAFEERAAVQWNSHRANFKMHDKGKLRGLGADTDTNILDTRASEPRCIRADAWALACQSSFAYCRPSSDYIYTIWYCTLMHNYTRISTAISHNNITTCLIQRWYSWLIAAHM